MLCAATAASSPSISGTRWGPQEHGRSLLRFALEHPLHYCLLVGTPLPDPAAHPEMMAEACHAFQLVHEAIGDIKLPAGDAERQLDALFWATVNGPATILITAAPDEIGLDKVVLAEALPPAFHRIGKALAP